MSSDEARHLQREAAKAGVGCWFVQDTDYILQSHLRGGHHAAGQLGVGLQRVDVP
jgi:hypothetical protein